MGEHRGPDLRKYDETVHHALPLEGGFWMYCHSLEFMTCKWMLVVYSEIRLIRTDNFIADLAANIRSLTRLLVIVAHLVIPHNLSV